MNFPLNPSVLLVMAIPLLGIIYLFANRLKSGTIHPMEKWHDLDILQGIQTHSLPANIGEIMEKVNIEQNEQSIGGAVTFIQTAEPPQDVKLTGKVVLLLHGAAFTSQTWVDEVPTIATLAALGNKVIAIDLPGFGKTKDEVEDKGSYLSEVIDVLTPNVRPVIVTPSLSGSFIIPLLEKSPEKISAWVPVAPINTEKGRDFFPQLDIPTLIIYGELDEDLGIRSRDDLLLIPTSTKPQVLPGAKHPAYLDQPDLWHQILYNFISALPDSEP
eukprot:GFUD01067453.1.p1 GENE.GFUD01067453.1~~GFUD01067453.1.p1  ORF type:complete len:272 (+),score=53.56 GFUD01067453.1:94-909(+)